MAAITWTDVVDVAPALSTVDADAQTMILAYVNAELDVVMFGGEAAPKTKLARVYLAAHLGTLSRPGASATAAGPVVSESAGGLSRSYANMVSSTSSAGLERTTFGTMYAFLVGTSLARAPRVA